MIVNLRKYMKNKSFKAILWITLFSVVGGISFLPMIKMVFKKRSENAVASINGYEVSFNEFRRQFSSLMQFIRQAQAQYGDQADIILNLWGINKDKNPEQLTLENLISQNVILSASEKLGAKIGNEYIQEKLKDQYFVGQNLSDLIPVQLYQNGVLDVNMLSMYLQRQNISHDEFEQMINNALERNLFYQLLRVSSYETKSMIKDEYIKEYSKRKYGILSLPLNKYISKVKEKPAQDTDFKNFYEQHKESYRVPQKRKGKVWTFALENFGVSVGAKDIENYYNKNKGEFLKSPSGREIRRIIVKVTNELNEELANKKAHEIYKEVSSKPELFDKYAQKETLKITRGKDNVDLLLENAAFNLTKLGEISPVTKTKDAFEIIKLINKKDPEYKDLALVKDEIAKKLKNEKFVQEFSSNAQRVISQAQDTPEIFSSFISQKSAKESDLGPSEKKADDLANQKLFALNNKGDRATYIDNNKGYIVELTSIEQSYITPFDQIKNKVAEDFYKEKGLLALQADLNQIVNSKESLEKVAKDYQAKYEVTDLIDPQDSNSMKKLQDKDVPFESALNLAVSGSKVHEVGANNGYVIELKEVDKFDEKDFESKKNLVTKKLNNQQVRALSNSLIDYLTKTAKIEVNDQMLKRASSRI